MEKDRINRDMSTLDAIMALGEGNPDALTVLANLANHSTDDTWVADLITLDSYRIYGTKIWTLYKNCCGEQLDNFRSTIGHIRLGLFPIQKVQLNLESTRPVPFVDEKVVAKYLLPGQEIVLASALYSGDYQKEIRESFEKRTGTDGMGSGKKPPQPGDEDN